MEESGEQSYLISKRRSEKQGKYLNRARNILRDQSKRSIEWYSENPSARGYVEGIAKGLMKAGVEHKNFKWALIGAELYERVGKGDKYSVKRKLVKSIDYEKLPPEKDLGRAEDIVGENIVMLKNKMKNLENKISGSVFGFVFVIGLFFLSSNLTGSVIGNLTKKTDNLIGIVLVLWGVVGFFCFRKIKN